MFTNKSYNEPLLLRRIAEGDEEAFTILFNQFKDKIFSLSVKLTGAAAVAEDIVQEVFLKLWLKRAELTEINNITGYLLTITKHSILNELRKQTRDRQKNTSYAEHIESWFQEQQRDPVLEKEVNRLLREAVYHLPEQQRIVYLLIREEGLKRNEVAARLGLSPETVKKHLTLATRHLRSFYLAHLDKIVSVILLKLLY